MSSLSRRLAPVAIVVGLSIAPARAAQTPACPLGAVAAPLVAEHYMGKVLGPAPLAEIERQTRIAERATGGTVSPDYVKRPRILAEYFGQGAKHIIIAAVLDDDAPPAGATVSLASRRRDPRNPCHFIPWTVTFKGQVAILRTPSP